MNELNAKVVAEFRANAGRVVNAMGGHFKDIHLLLLHTVGRHSGNQYVTPLLYVEDGDAYVLVGSNGGAAKEPEWVANVVAMSEVVVEVGDKKITTKPTVLRNGPEWDRLHCALAEYWPEVLTYQILTTRTFPLIVLEALPDSARH
ncbi:nitroreductase/quinone reductase family protein [Mycobacterium sp. URHB0021]|jgi:deazaflavin-dependent oxidoreductase (nitroreductase family)